MATQVSGSHGTAASTPVANEDIWISGRAGERASAAAATRTARRPRRSRRASRTTCSTVAVNLDVPRAPHVDDGLLLTNGVLPAGTNAANPGDNDVRGVPWDLAIQPILDAKCASCHNGDASKSYNPSYTVTDMTIGHVADLRLRPPRHRS